MVWVVLKNRFEEYEVVPYVDIDQRVQAGQKKCTYRAIVTTRDCVINRYDKQDVLLYKILGPMTQKGNLRLIILKTDEQCMI